VDAGPHRQAVGGKLLGAQWLDLLGAAAVLGVDPATILRADDIERHVLIDILHRAVEYQEKREGRLAEKIIRELAEALKR